MGRIGWTASAVIYLLWQTPLLAASVVVDGDDPRRSITVTIEGATVDLVLEDLRKKYGFEVTGLQNAAKGDALSATLSGNLRSVLERLLRNWNHVIVGSSDASGIAKVVIIDATYGAQPSKAGQTRANGDDPEKMMQALSGRD